MGKEKKKLFKLKGGGACPDLEAAQLTSAIWARTIYSQIIQVPRVTTIYRSKDGQCKCSCQRIQSGKIVNV